MAVVKGTTPTFIFTTPIDLTEASKVWVTLSTMSECELITKSNEDLIITSESVSVFLSQTETLSLPKGQIKAQLNWLYQEGNIKLKSGNVLSYYVNTSSYGLLPNITYRYIITYSS